MHLVEVNDIPKVDEIVDVPTDNLVEVYKVCQQMEEVCNKSNGIGLSAVQVGIPWKLFLVKNPTDDSYGYYINCEYSPRGSEKIISTEGCLSLVSGDNSPRLFVVDRLKSIAVKGFELLDTGGLRVEPFEKDFEMSYENVVFQHEIDHQLGILISDIGKEVFIW